MTVTEAKSGSRLAGAERSAGGITVLIHRSRQGSHLTRSTPGDAGPSQPQRWVFPNLYDLLVFARAKRVYESRCRGNRLSCGLWLGLRFI